MRFLFPSGWLVETPTITENGEAGNIGANNFIKGDGCNFAALPVPKGQSYESLTKNKEFFKGWLTSQMRCVRPEHPPAAEHVRRAARVVPRWRRAAAGASQ